jgi:predicted NAD-dependent protein-ADP-ribosyltransferase YbiA (DUF1768 family)
MIDFTNYKEGEYAAFSDDAPLSFQMNGTMYACSTVAILQATALKMGNAESYTDVIQINQVMLKFVEDFGANASPRFWSRWDEQLSLLSLCREKMNPIESSLVYKVICAKIAAHEHLRYLLIATEEKELIGASYKTAECLYSIRSMLLPGDTKCTVK